MPTGVDHDKAETLFVVVWAAMAVGTVIFSKAALPQTKRSLWPALVVAAAVIFLFFVYLFSGVPSVCFALIPITLIVYINARTIKHCPKCGSANRNMFVFPLPRFCMRCGTSLGGASS